MADKRISQLIERVDIANNDVLPIVASGATTTNKVTISTIQEWMQDNLDVGVTSVGITLGSAGTDVNVTGSPITTSGNITINLPDASASARGLVTTGSQVFGGVKTFANGISLPAVGGSNQTTRIVNIGTLHEGSASLNQIGFNSGNNIYFGKGLSNGGVISWNNAAVRYYTLPDADGTIALASQLDGYVTLNTTQTITGEKTFNNRLLISNSGSLNSLDVLHSSGSGIAVDISKAGDGEGLRVTKTSGSGNAVTISGDASITGVFSLTNSTTTYANLNSTNASGASLNFQRNGVNMGHIGNSGVLGVGVLDDLEVRAGSTRSLHLKTDGGQVTLASGGAITLTGALNGTSATFSGIVQGVQGNFYQSASSGNAIQLRNRNANQTWGLVVDTDAVDDKNLGFYTGSVYALKLSASTGAATFSGALNGTSASFSGNGLFGGSSAVSGLAGGISVNGSTNSGINFRIADALRGYVYVAGNGSMNLESTSGSIVLSPNGTPALTIASTGAATFSENVGIGATADSNYPLLVSRTGAGVALQIQNTNSYSHLRLQSSGTNQDSYLTLNPTGTGSAIIQVGDVNRVTIASTGAATFSSSVTAEGTFIGKSNATYQNGSTNILNVGSDEWMYGGTNSDGGVFVYGNNKLHLSTNSQRRLSIDGSGNVGIGTTSPNLKLQVDSTSGDGVYISSFQTTSGAIDTGSGLYFGFNDGTNNRDSANIRALKENSTVGNRDSYLSFGTRKTGEVVTEKMRLTSGGQLQVGGTVQSFDARIVIHRNAYSIESRSTGTGSEGHVVFRNGNGAVGTIFTNGSSTSYNTSSDYRLKENVKPVENALSVLTQLKPCTFNFIADADEEVMGFIAHEVQEVIPQAVHGQKDEVEIKQVEVSPAELDEEGNVITEAVIEEKEVPVYQGIDHSKLVPLLVAAMQEQQEQIKSLTEQVEALKSQING